MARDFERLLRSSPLGGSGNPPGSRTSLGTVWTAVLVGAVLILGTAFWAAVGLFFIAWKDAQASLPVPVAATATVAGAPTGTPGPIGLAVVPTSAATPATAATQTAVPATSTPKPAPTPAPTSSPTPKPDDGGRPPWVLLPGPPAGARVAPGTITIEARGRGDAPIKSIQLELDGRPVPTTLEQRSEVIWRGYASVSVSAGRHEVRAVVVDEQGRTGSHRWSFDAS